MTRPCGAGWLVADAFLMAFVLAVAPEASAVGADVTMHVSQCAACHGADGRSGAMPANGRIAGQNRGYLAYILRQYRVGGPDGVNGGIMSAAVRHLDDVEIDSIAAFYSTMP